MDSGSRSLNLSARGMMRVAQLLIVGSAGAAVLAATSPTRGYEVSLYASTSLTVWILLCLALFGGALVAVTSGSKGKRGPVVGLWGVAASVSGTSVFLGLPLIRGYYLYGRGDLLTHLGEALDVLSSGHTSPSNFYPVTHILMSELTLLLGVPLHQTAMVMSIGLGLCFASGVLLLLRLLYGNGAVGAMALAFAPLLIFGGYNALAVPNAFSVLVFPLPIYLYLKSAAGVQYTIALTVFLILFPFLHPLTSISLLVALIGLGVFPHFRRLVTRGRAGFGTSRIRRSLTPSAILGVTLLFWLSSFALFGQSVELVVRWLSSEATSQADRLSTLLAARGFSGVGLVDLALRLYGPEIALAVLGVAASLDMVVRSLRGKPVDMGLLSLVVPFVLQAMLFFVLLSMPSEFGQRAVQYTAVFAVLLAPAILIRLFPADRDKRRVVAFTVVIVIIGSLGLANVYDSPYVSLPNQQVTTGDVAGTAWLVDHKTDTVPVITISSVQFFRLVDLVAGSKEASQRSDISPYNPGSFATDHFGYNRTACFGGTVPGTRIFVLSSFDKDLYTQVWTFVPRYSDSDFSELETDASVSTIYSNGGFTVYLVIPGVC